MSFCFNTWFFFLFRHIYHYYIHGPEGNKDLDDESEAKSKNSFNNINIRVGISLSHFRYCLPVSHCNQQLGSHPILTTVSKVKSENGFDGTHSCYFHG